MSEMIWENQRNELGTKRGGKVSCRFIGVEGLLRGLTNRNCNLMLVRFSSPFLRF